MTRLERHQAWAYLAAIGVGLGLGTWLPGLARPLDALVWPALAVLLTVTFLQVPLTRLPAVAGDVRFLGTVLVGNFVLLPLVVWTLLPLAGDDLAVRVGVLLVLLVPCTDWFLTFTHLAGGDTRRALVVTPLNLLLQLALLPGYLWLLLGASFREVVTTGRVAVVFATLIVVPLLVALVLQRLARERPVLRRRVRRTGVLPVPSLAVVVSLIAASQVGLVLDAVALLPRLLGLFLVFLVVAAALGLLLARVASLPAPAARAVVFSLGTRNSFVVLPFALALPVGLEVAVVVVVFQSLVELFGMVAYLRVIPRLTPTR